MKTKSIIIFSLLFNTNILNAAGDMTGPGENNNIAVMLITIIIWLALAIYIFYLTRRVKSLEKKLGDE